MTTNKLYDTTPTTSAADQITAAHCDFKNTITLKMPQPVAILRRLFEDKALSDVKLFGKSRPGNNATPLPPILAHKNILSSTSPHLHELLTADCYTDSNKPEYTFDNINHDTLEALVQLIYTDEITFNSVDVYAQVSELLVAADFLQISVVTDACELILLHNENLKTTNCVPLWRFARKYHRYELMHAASITIATCLPYVMQQTEFLTLTPDELTKLFLSEPVIVANADERCLAAAAWLKQDPDARSIHAKDVLNLVPHEFDAISADTLLTLYNSNAIRAAVPEHFYQAFVQGVSKRKLDDVITESNSRVHRDVWYLVGGCELRVADQFLEYDILHRAWSKRGNLHSNREYNAVAVMENRLVTMGGKTNRRPTPDIDEYNFSTRTWTKADAKLTRYERLPTMCTGGSAIYAFAGSFDGFSVEAYNIGDKTTTKMADMISKRSLFTAAYATQNNCAYVAGGCFPDTNPNEIAMLNISKNQWSAVGTMPVPREKMASVVLGHDLYLIGGRGNVFRENGVEIFNIDRGGITRNGPALMSPRLHSKGIILNENTLCAVGGISFSGVVLRTVEVLDIREGKWTTGIVVPDMPHATWGFGLTSGQWQ